MFPEDPDDTVWICMCPDEAVVAVDSPDIECNDPPPRISRPALTYLKLVDRFVACVMQLNDL
eukprot:scaffold1300_cov197-Chaetoceros_neogracile.AAC.1